MLGVSGMIGTASGDGAAAAAAAEAQESGGTSGGSGGTAGTNPGGGGGGFSEEDKARMEDEGERAGGVGVGGGGGGGGGNRWPRQETLALLKIRSDMDVVFRDSSLKGPLWEQVSRKMADLGYHRSAKKCKEKFENVYKYHKRTKEGRSTKPEGKTYRFFDQLAALENTSSSSAQISAPPPRPQAPPMAPPVPTQAITANQNPPIAAQLTVSSATNNAVSGAQNTTASTTPVQSFNNFINSSFPPTQPLVLPQANTAANVSNPPQSRIVPPSHQTISTSFLSNSPSSSSSTSSDEDIERRHKRKRKWKDFFERLMKDVIDKQEELQKRFLETLEKRERDRMIREEAWRVQEMARINREHDLLVQERSMAAARESALVTFLQKMTQNPNSTNAPQLQIPAQQNPLPQQAPPPPPPPASAPATTTPVVLAPAPAPAPLPPIRTVENTPKSDNGGENFMGTTSSRWPKAEVEALIQLRTSLDNKYQESAPKGPLWEDISSGMRKLGYNRNAKRCKEKWENINKYFKKVKESNKKRPEDSKTCPYFHQLEALYKERAKTDASSYNTGYANAVKPENPMIPIMARPEQQWPLPQDQQQQQQQQDSAMDEHEDDNIDENDHDDDDDDDGDDDEEDEGSGYEIVTNKPSSVATTVQ